MLFFKNAACLLISLTLALADKKIELEDIEEDNLKSEKATENDTDDYKPRPTIVVTGSAGTARGADLNTLNGFLRLYETPVQIQQPNYVPQYAVTENQDRASGGSETTLQKPEFPAPGATPTMVGYLSNVPMQILYIPQYYANPSQSDIIAPSPGIQYVAPISKVNIAPLHGSESQDQQHNYVEIPAYVTPSGKGYPAPMPQYTPQFTYVTYGSHQPTVSPSNAHSTAVVPSETATPHNVPSAPAAYNSHIGPIPSAPATYTSQSGPVYAMPIAYQHPMVSRPMYRPYYPNNYYHYETNSIDDGHQTESQSSKPDYAATERPHTKLVADSVRYYTSRMPMKGERGQPSQISELPAPSPLLYESQPAHLAGIPKVLPYYRPITKPVYSHISGNLIPNSFSTKPRDGGFNFLPKKRPTSLLDSYVPSSVQLEYMKRGLGRDPLTTYEALSGYGGKYIGGGGPQPRHLERGFLPNQMYHTASGGVTYGHYKRNQIKRDIVEKKHN